jgi:hypothetical protein
VSIRQIQRAMFHVLKAYPTRLTDGEFRILMYVAWDARPDGRRQFVTLRKLADNAQFPISTVRLTLRRFAERGWMQLTKADGQIVDWQLTIERDDLLKTLLISCGNPVEKLCDAVMQDPGDAYPGSGVADPASQQNRVKPQTSRGLAVLSVFYPSFIRLKEEEAALRAASPSPNLHSENADPKPPNPERQAVLDELRLTMARIEAQPAPPRRRRFTR